jgi:Ca-activated chloride channel family protein
VLPATARPPAERRFELHLVNSEGGKWDEISVENQTNGQVEAISLVNGIARNRVAPGLYRVTVETGSIRNLALADLVVGAEGGFFEVTLPPPLVTLEPFPEQPVVGGTVFIHYWGAPEGRTWIALAPKGAPLGGYVLRQPATAGEGEVAFRLPGEMIEFEARCVSETPAGVLLLRGSRAFASRLEIARLQAPERVEIKTPLTIDWSGPDLPGDRIMIGRAEGEGDGWAACLFTTAGSPLRLAAPVVPGKYRISYVSSGERVLARSDLEVYEILAVLVGPETVGPGEEFSVDWEGPDGTHDFVAISAVDAPSEEYLDFSPTTVGPSVSLRAPDREGRYELRYVRSSDGEVLAREEIAVVAAAVSLEAPKKVDAGSRFTVTWSGTSSEGDFVALAPEGSKPRRHLDFAFTSQGHTLSLAAPFKPGRYEVRYISASGGQVLARVPLRVR